MAIPVSHDEIYTTDGLKAPLLFHRWAGSNTAVVVDIGSTALYTMEGSINRMGSDVQTLPVWFQLSGLVGLTTDITDVIRHTPLSAIRINITDLGTTLRFQVRQSGEG